MTMTWMRPILLAVFAIGGTRGAPTSDEGIDLTIIHINDIHSYFEETNANSARCREESTKCYGGVARVYTMKEQILKDDPEALFLNAGDFYQGTVWYSKFKYGPMIEFGNRLNYTAMGLGNHDFDDSIPGIEPFSKQVEFPLLAANINHTGAPEMADIYNKSTVITVKGVKVGIIGYITRSTAYNFLDGKVTFTDEIEAVRKEAKELTSQNVTILIALGHSGYEIDQQLAESVSELDLVVGGHSHTFLYTPENEADVPEDKVDGPYPTYVTNKATGKVIPVVQAKCYTKYLGKLVLSFDPNGEVKTPVAENGVRFARPLLLDGSVIPDEDTLKMEEKWKANLTEYKTVIGRTEVVLVEDISDSKESNIGNAITDSMVDVYDDATIAVLNNGGIRSSFEMGDITGEDVFYVLPFQNTVDKLRLSGASLKAALEKAAAKLDPQDPLKYPGFGLQVSGLEIVIDLTVSSSSNSSQRITSIKAKQAKNGKLLDVDDDFMYTMAVGSFLAPSGKQRYLRGIFDDIEDVTHTPGDVVDYDAMTKWINKTSPIKISLEGRLTVHYPVSAGQSIKAPIGCLMLISIVKFLF